jgi:hypothetical protein
MSNRTGRFKAYRRKQPLVLVPAASVWRTVLCSAML